MSLSNLVKSRANATINKEILKPVSVKSVNDVKRVIAPFIKENKDKVVNFSSEVSWKDDDGNTNKTMVSATSTDPDMRTALLSGFEQVKEQEKLWQNIYSALDDDEYGASLPIVHIDDFVMPIDRLIRNRLGGKRVGYKIVWEVSGKEVVFDPYTKDLDIRDI